MASLYELTLDAQMLMELLESGEIDEQTFADTLESLDVDSKIENVCKVIRMLEADAEAYKKEKDRMAQRQKTVENGIQRLKNSLLDYLSATEQKSVKTGIFDVSMRTADKLNIVDDKSIPCVYLIEQEPKIDVAGIKKAIKDGEIIAGAELVKSPYVTIR